MAVVEFLVDHCSRTIGSTSVFAPLHRVAATLYLYGPSFDVGQVKLGFWQGRDPVDVCSVMTGVRSDLWRANEEACLSVLAERFFGVYYAVYVVVALWAGLLFVRGVGSLASAGAFRLIESASLALKGAPEQKPQGPDVSGERADA
jgi:hypothetical protein